MQNEIIGCWIRDFDKRLLSHCKTRPIYETTDGPTGRPGYNLPNSDGFGDFHWTLLERIVRLICPPGPIIWVLYGSELDPDGHPTQSDAPEPLQTLSQPIINIMPAFLGKYTSYDLATIS